MLSKLKKKVGALFLTALMITSTSAASANDESTVTTDGNEALFSTVISIESTRNAASEGEPVSFVARVYSTESSTAPTGTVTFKDGDTVLGSSELDAYDVNPRRTVFSVRNLSAGEHQITAEYSGDSQFSAITSSPVTQTVSAEAMAPAGNPTVTTVESYLNPSQYGDPVTFYIKTRTNPQIYNDIAGTVILMDGDTELATIPMWPHGEQNGIATATFTTSTLSVGDHPITAKYYGDTRFDVEDSTSAPITQTVLGSSSNPTPSDPADENTGSSDGNTAYENTSISVQSTRNPASVGEPVTFMAMVNREYTDGTYDYPTGTVTFKEGDTVLGTAPLGTDPTKPVMALLTVENLSAGEHEITAEYGGDSKFIASTSEPITQTVSAEAVPPTTHPTVTTVVSYLNPSHFGNSVTIVVQTITDPLQTKNISGTAILMDGDTVLAVLAMSPNGEANGKALGYFTTSDLTVGDHPLTAKYLGDTRFGIADSTSEVMTQVVLAGSGSEAPSEPSSPSGTNQHEHGSSSVSTPVDPDTEAPVTSETPETTAPEQTNTPANSDEYQNPDDIFRSRVVNADSNVIAGVEARTADILSKGDSLVALNYDDVAQHWAIPSIEKLTKLGVINGYPDGGFEPDEQITRAEFAAMIDRAFVDMASRNLTINEEDFADFSDINGHWSTDDLKKLVEVGVLNGYEDGTIRPEKTITRQEMALIITRVLNASILNIDTSNVPFTDLNGAFGADAIKKAAALGIFDGKTEQMFDPNSGATRAEAIETIIKTYSLSPSIKASLKSLGE
ncbi:Ig-like domain repeat protein [Paenibacillus pinistramenti]|uniref:Ig-like domain repeat protein n=1 Tax=Paenibacillus pinistramenti TaxID=1768003 RepID=UPI0013967748|nr:Ig-like domain repeat protein [Paenibacillus pinistramenti]